MFLKCFVYDVQGDAIIKTTKFMRDRNKRKHNEKQIWRMKTTTWIPEPDYWLLWSIWHQNISKKWKNDKNQSPDHVFVDSEEMETFWHLHDSIFDKLLFSIFWSIHNN